ncbi:hypothetical protein HY251_01635 [bacterium]|nr:hypothetical protein [bacterium]
MRARDVALSSLLVSILGAPAWAEDMQAADLAGTWKRDAGEGETARLIKLEAGSSPDELVGKMLNAPEAAPGKPYGVEIHLRLSGNKLEGAATWIEENPKKGQPGQQDEWRADARWDLTVDSQDKLSGKTEWLSWGRGKVEKKGFDNHTFTRLAVLSLGGKGTAPASVEAGLPIDEKAVAGCWRTSLGSVVTIKAKDGGFVAERVKGGPPATIKLANDGNILRGSVTLGNLTAQVELKLASPGRLEGRCERVEGDDASSAKKSWEPLELDVLARIDGAGASDADAPALGAGAQGASLALDSKRDDGLYLKLTARGSGYEGELVSKADGVRAKVVLSPGSDGKLTGTVTWKDGAETHWELAPQADGTIEARCEWVDWDGKSAVGRGFTARKFKPLRKAG